MFLYVVHAPKGSPLAGGINMRVGVTGKGLDGPEQTPRLIAIAKKKTVGKHL